MNTYPEQDCFRRDVPKDAAEILANDILKEQATRINEDALIRASIADETTARAQRDSQLELWFNTEEADRISADNALGVQIADEATDRSDADTLLAAAISAEEEARIAADTSLGDAIVDEEDARIAADKALDSRLDAIEPFAMTEAEKTKLAGIAAGAEVNVNADWDSVSGASQILNKPDIPDSMFDFSDHSRFIFGDNAYGSSNITGSANSIVKSGFYRLPGDVGTDGPEAGITYHLLHIQNGVSENFAVQHAYQAGVAVKSYIRVKNNGTWGSWKKLWNSENGGSGSGLDADLLDGLHSSSFATAAQGAKADAALPSTSYTAADVLTKIKTVAGGGSGLDSDLVRGLAPVFTAASALPVLQYSVSDFNTIPYYGVLFVTTASPANAPLAGYSVGLQMAMNNDINYKVQFVMSNNDGAVYSRRQAAGTWGNWSKIWNSTNDGSGSGLETDKIPFATKTGTSTGSQGQASFDASYLYLCTATNVWKRVALTSF